MFGIPLIFLLIFDTNFNVFSQQFPIPNPNLLQILATTNRPVRTQKPSDDLMGLGNLGLGLVEQGQGLIEELLNSVQLGVRNAIDNFVPNIKLGPSNRKTNEEVTLPPPFHRLFQTCPPCMDLDPGQFSGKNWSIVYANDNFIKNRLSKITKIAAGQTDVSSNTLQDLFSPLRSPVCPTLQVGGSISFGFLTDYLATLSLRESRPTATLRTVAANLRHAGNGKYALAIAGADLYIKLCAAFSNIVKNPQNLALNSTQAKLVIFSDMGGFPKCQNFIVLTTNTEEYFKELDNEVMKFIESYKADTNVNPLQYIGCPFRM